MRPTPTPDPGLPAARQSSSQAALLLADDRLFDEHAAPGGAYHPERPARLEAARAAVRGWQAQPLPFVDATDEQLRLVHTSTYLAALDRLAGREGYLDADTYYCSTSTRVARSAAGAVVGLTRAALELEETTIGLALTRPPGHHALPDRAMGFCLLNHVAVGAALAVAKGCKRVAIVDIDVHHGNGTEQIFYEDPRVLYVSLHQREGFPGTGASTDRGSGGGLGFTANIPLSAGATDAVYEAAFERIVSPLLSSFGPEFLFISAGFDAHRNDPLSSMQLTRAGYLEMGAALRSATAPGTPIVAVLEGGYDLLGLQEGLDGLLEGLLAPPSAEPTKERTPMPGSSVHQADLDEAFRAVGRCFPP